MSAQAMEDAEVQSSPSTSAQEQKGPERSDTEATSSSSDPPPRRIRRGSEGLYNRRSASPVRLEPLWLADEGFADGRARERTEALRPFREESDRTRPISSSARTASSSQQRSFSLVIRQQPEVGCESGLEPVTLGRLPIVPAPVVQFVARDEHGDDLERADLSHLCCTCFLKQEDGVTPVEIPTPPRRPFERSPESLSALLGHKIRRAQHVKDLDDVPMTVFVFEDVSVRLAGRYTLEFKLGETGRPDQPELALIVSEPFDVVPWIEYPGRPSEEILTPLSRKLLEQHVPIYVPPLVLNPSGSNLPPVPPPVSRHGSSSGGGTSAAPSEQTSAETTPLPS